MVDLDQELKERLFLKSRWKMVYLWGMKAHYSRRIFEKENTEPDNKMIGKHN